VSQAPIFGHIFLCSQNSQDECPNHFTESYPVENGKNAKNFVACCTVVQLKNAPNLFSAGVPLWTLLGELMMLSQTPSHTFSPHSPLHPMPVMSRS